MIQSPSNDTLPSSALQTRSRWTRLARHHPAYLGEYCLGLKPEPFHVEWQDECTKHNRLVLFAPVEHGKSTQLSVIRPLWELGKNPDARIAIISQTASRAERWLSVIKTNILYNSRLREVFPELKPETLQGWAGAWYQHAIRVQRTTRASLTEGDFSLLALGLQGRLLGARLDGVILDDVLGPENTMTGTMRQKVWDWIFGVLVGRIVEGGFIWAVNTAWHENDAYHRIERELGDVYRVVRYKAGVAPCLWPGRWSLERLKERRHELGEVEYNRQMLNIALGEATEFFHIPRVRECQDRWDSADRRLWDRVGPEDAKRFRWITCGMDFGGSDTPGSAETAFFVQGLRKDSGLKQPLHMRKGLWIGAQLLEQVVDVFKTYSVREFLVETNAMQLHLASMAKNPRILAALGLTRQEIRGFRVFGQYTTKYNRDDKTWGIRAMATEFDGLEWLVPRDIPIVEEWIDAMRAFTPWDHPPDILVASWLANLRMAGKGKPVQLRARSIGG